MLFALIAIASGLVAIFKIVVDIEIALGFVTLSFGVLAIIWTTMAVRSLSKGSTLRTHTRNFLLCLIFILLFSIWHTLGNIFHWRSSLNEMLLYPGYVFLIIAFLIFVYTSFHILKMGKEFGFQGEAQKIVKIIEEKKRKAK